VFSQQESLMRKLFVFASVFLVITLSIGTASGAVAPVGQLPSVIVSVTPSIYALPLLLVEELDEWKDFGIQVNLKVPASEEKQLDGTAANEWDWR